MQAACQPHFQLSRHATACQPNQVPLPANPAERSLPACTSRSRWPRLPCSRSRLSQRHRLSAGNPGTRRTRGALGPSAQCCGTWQSRGAGQTMSRRRQAVCRAGQAAQERSKQRSGVRVAGCADSGWPPPLALFRLHPPAQGLTPQLRRSRTTPAPPRSPVAPHFAGQRGALVPLVQQQQVHLLPGPRVQLVRPLDALLRGAAGRAGRHAQGVQEDLSGGVAWGGVRRGGDGRWRPWRGIRLGMLACCRNALRRWSRSRECLGSWEK